MKYNQSSMNLARASISGVLCFAVLCGILVAGLWPFHSPKNEVSWLRSENGIRFGEYGTALSSGLLKMIKVQDESSCSLEIWLQPGLTHDTNTFFAFYTPRDSVKFSLHQSNTDLVLQSQIRNDHQTRTRRMYVENIFRQEKPVFITIASDAQGTAIYIDGALVRTSPQFRFSSKDCTGQLVVGDSPVSSDSWSGQLRGLAIYNKDLTAAQVSQHYEGWTKKGRPDIDEDERNVAMYLFNEHTGNVIHNQVIQGVDLYIPQRYLILHEIFLEPPWKEFQPDWGYWKNVLINIAGFIPFGFFSYAYFSSARPIKRAALATITLGATISLTIEILQAYLPTRQSGMTDLITNTLGTSLGAMMYRLALVRTVFHESLNRIGSRVHSLIAGTCEPRSITKRGSRLARLPRS